MTERPDYDEFAYFADNAAEHGVDYVAPTVRRESVHLDDGRRMSALVWGNAPAHLVLIHGGAQNAHTWDTVGLALGRPFVAIDLPGHGHSDAAVIAPGEVRPTALARDVAKVIEQLAPTSRLVVGMSLGGLTAIALTALRPDLVKRLALIDVTPGVDGDKAKAIVDFVRGPATFDSFDDLLARTIEFNPTRTEASLRRGILHNAIQLDDGSWMWRYRRHGDDLVGAAETRVSGSAEMNVGNMASLGAGPELWDALGAVRVPVLLVRGMRSQSVVDDADEAEFRRRLPSGRVAHVAEAGHSVQGDTPVELAALLDDFIDD